jgi:nucleoside-diphosphate-sugar epimerase
MNDLLQSAQWRGRRVVVLGANGFIGRHLMARLCKLEAEVVAGVFQAPSATLSADWPGVTVLRGDVCDERYLVRLVEGADAIFALAGSSGAARSNQSPIGNLAVNGGGLLRLLDAARLHAPEARVVFPSSRLVYESSPALPVVETHPTKPRSIYAIHKLLGESYIKFYHEMHGVRGVSLRVTNPYGSDIVRSVFTHGIVNQFFRLAARGEPICIFGDGAQLRDYIHIDDVVDALLICSIDPRAAGEVFNLGTGEPTRLSAVAESIVKLVGRGEVRYVPWPADQLAVETGDFYADISKLQRTLEWQPLVRLQDGLAQLAAEMRT